MSDAYAAPASRNAPCPCGSGRRWKDCHGRVVATPARGLERSAALIARMTEALALQRSGRFAEAIAAYSEVIDAAPDTFDAWHMRGVARLQSHAFDDAEADIRRALALKPDLPLGASNLALVASGRRSADAAERLSREALARFRPLVVDPPRPPLDGVGAGMRCFVVDLGASSPEAVERIAREAADRGAAVRRTSIGDDGRLPSGDEDALARAGEGDAIVAIGCASPPGDWTMACAPRSIALLADGASAGDLEDRLRELSAQGRRAVRLAAAPGLAVDVSALPHVELAP